MEPDKRQGPCPPAGGRLDGVDSSAGNGHHERTPPTDALRRLMDQVVEIREYGMYFLAAKTDSIKSSIRNVAMYAGLGVIGLMIASTVVATATVLLLVGIAWGLGLLLWGHLWAGALLTGLLILGTIGLGAYIALSRVTKVLRHRTVDQYEQRKKWQRQQFGHDVDQRAEEAERTE